MFLKDRKQQIIFIMLWHDFYVYYTVVKIRICLLDNKVAFYFVLENIYGKKKHLSIWLLKIWINFIGIKNT